MIKKIYLILFVLFSCSNEISNQSNPDNISLFVITEDITLGENRVVYTVLDKEGNNISENMNFKLKKLDDSKQVIIDDYELIDWPGNRSVFKSDLAFDSTGYWEIIGEYKKSNTKGVIEVKEISSTLNTGEKVSSIKPPSLENKKIIDLSTDIEPDINLYSHSLDIALEKKVPIILSFSTPGLCVTAICAPQLNVLKEIRSNYQDKLIVIHVEIWENFKEIMNTGDFSVGNLNESVQLFGITSEPWTFLINNNGFVENRYQGFVDYKELKKDLSKINVYDQ